MGIGLKIKTLLSRDHIDAPALAKIIGKSKQAVYDMLEKEDLNTSLLRMLSKIFNVPITYFFDEEDNKVVHSQEYIDSLIAEIDSLKEEIERLKAFKSAGKNDRLYELWMQFMKCQAQHHEIMKEMATLYGTL